MSVRELLATTDGNELSEWMAYDRIEPAPDPYWCAALVASTVARALGNGKARLEDYLPRPAGAKAGAAPPGRLLAVFDSLTRDVRRA